MSSIKLKKPAAILLDIEGTTTDISFVSKTLFPFVKANIGNYFEETYNRAETQELINFMRKSQKSLPDFPPIASPDSSRSAIVHSVTEYAHACIKEKQRSSEIKQLQILIWIWGYEKAMLRGHVYDEVTTCMHWWKNRDGIELYVFSSGMIAAQQLLLCYTNHGNCMPLISDFFDSAMGDKIDPQSFCNIAAKIGQPTNRILFITDNAKEAKAAIDANCAAVIIKRPKNKIKGLDKMSKDIPLISTFEDIQFQ